MCEENELETFNKLIEISSLLYVLHPALDSECQPTSDTTPFADLANVIKDKLQTIIEKLTYEQIINK